MIKPDINNSVWRAAQDWGGGTPPRFFDSRAKRRFDPRAVKGGSTAQFVKGLLSVTLTWDVPGWGGDPFALVRVVYQRPDGIWVVAEVFKMTRDTHDFGFTDVPVSINTPDGAWVGVVLYNVGGVRTDVAVIRYDPSPPEPKEEEENMSVLADNLKHGVIMLEGDASDNLSAAISISTKPVTITMVEVRVIRDQSDERVQVVLNAQGIEIAEFWTEPGRDFYVVPIYPGVELGADHLVRATARFNGDVNLRAKFRGYAR